MGFQPFDTRMYQFDRESNIRILYDCMLERENIAHYHNEKGFLDVTIKQLVETKKMNLSKSQIETSLKKLIEYNIIGIHKKGNFYDKTPTIYKFIEIIERQIGQRNRTEKSDGEKKNKPKKINALSRCKILQIGRRNRTEKSDTYNRLNLIDLSLKEKGIEKELTFMERYELFNKKHHDTDLCYFDAMNEMEKSKKD